MFSEIEILGVKLKREIEKTKEEVKEKINDLHMLITDLKITNSNANTINVGNGFLPSEQKLKELEGFISNSNRIDDKSEINSTAKINMAPVERFQSNIKFEIAEESTFLFKVRFMLEKTLTDLCEKTNYEGNKSTYEMIRYLIRSELINGKTADMLNQIIKISNRGVHGEIVSNEYINFIKKVLPELQKQLNEININLHYFVCPKCKNYVYSRYNNICTNCGFNNDDD